MIQDKQIKSLEKQIAERQNKLAKLKKEKLESLLGQESLSIEERFNVWLNNAGPQKEYSWIQHIETRNGRDLLEYDDVMDWQRRELMTINRLAENLNDFFHNLNNLSEDPWFLKKKLTKEDIEDWMLKLMELEFKSCYMDW